MHPFKAQPGRGWPLRWLTAALVAGLALAGVLLRVEVVHAVTNGGANGNHVDPCSVDSDGDGLTDCQEDLNGNGIYEPQLGETDPHNPDSDGDGLTDGEERLHTGRIAALIAAKKIDFKALDQLDPTKPDSDDDCIPDGVELGVTKADAEALIARSPKRPHLVFSAHCRALLDQQNITTLANAIPFDESAAPGLDNIAMLYDFDPATMTDPTNADTDGDGLADGLEDRNFSGHRDFKCTADEALAAAVGASTAPSDSAPVKSASDTACPGTITWTETDPLNRDSDGDGLQDGEEGDRDGDGKLGPEECDPLKADTDGDGVPDGDERRFGTKCNVCDTDGDGLSDGVELGYIQPVSVGGCHGLTAAGTNYHHPHVMNPLNPDSDGDGLKDGEEDKNGNGWVDPLETDPSDPDTDGDGLDDYVETTGDFNHDGLPDFDISKVPAEGNCKPTIDDIDCDGIPNALDTDSDNDGCPDSQEGGFIDRNGNGIPDVYDKEAKLCADTAGGGGSTVGGGAVGGVSAKPADQTPPSNASALLNAPFLRDGTDGSACALVAPGAAEEARACGSQAVPLALAAIALALFRKRAHRSLNID